LSFDNKSLGLGSGNSLNSSFSFEDSGGSHAGTNAHRDNTVLLVGSLELTEESSDLASTSATKRVSKCYGATSGVELFLRNLEGVD